MAHLSWALTETTTIVQHTFFQDTLYKLIASFFSILFWLIFDWNEFIIWAIFLIYSIDLFTGVACAVIKKNFQSREFFKWLTKLLTYWIFMVIAVSVGKALFIWNSLLSWVFGFILITDSISILENLEKMGYNTPYWLKYFLKDYQEKLKSNKKENEK